jgi:hypothetical protein
MALDLDDPSAVALAVAGAFSAAGLEAALYGGLALAVYGECPRATKISRTRVPSSKLYTHDSMKR